MFLLRFDADTGGERELEMKLSLVVASLCFFFLLVLGSLSSVSAGNGPVNYHLKFILGSSLCFSVDNSFMQIGRILIVRVCWFVRLLRKLVSREYGKMEKFGLAGRMIHDIELQFVAS